MTVVRVEKDPANLAMTVTCEFHASVERVWQVWADPRQLERWWGPPTYPATVLEHDLTPGGKVAYHMTGPEGDTPGGWWKVLAVEPPTRLAFEDGFTDEAGEPATTMPTTRTEVTLEALPGGSTRMVIVSRFASLEAMQQMLEMGAEEGFRQALGQIDGIIAAEARPR